MSNCRGLGYGSSMFICLFFLIGSAWSEPAPPVKSPLAKLIELAEEHSPTIRNSRLALEKAQLERRTALAGFFPSLDVEAIHGPIAKEPDPDDRKTLWKSTTSLILKETLYDNGATITGYKKSSATLEREQKEYEYERDQQLLKVAQTYFDWSAAWEDRQIADSKKDSLKKQFNILEAQYKQGLKTKRDVLRIETEVRKLEIDLLKRDNDIEVLLERLAARAGIDRKTLAGHGINAETAKLDVPLPSGPWPELKAMDNRRQKILNLQSKEAEYDTRLVEREYWPRLTLEGAITNRYSDYVDTGQRFDHDPYWERSILLTLKYNIWDWGTRSRNLQIARINERTVGATNEQTLRDLDIELRQVWLKLGELAETVKMTKELLSIEQQSYNILQAEYRNGRATYLDLITNLNSLFDARSKYASSYFGFRQQQMTYAFHKGTIYEDLKSK